MGFIEYLRIQYDVLAFVGSVFTALILMVIPCSIILSIQYNLGMTGGIDSCAPTYPYRWYIRTALFLLIFIPSMMFWHGYRETYIQSNIDSIAAREAQIHRCTDKGGIVGSEYYGTRRDTGSQAFCYRPDYGRLPLESL